MEACLLACSLLAMGGYARSSVTNVVLVAGVVHSAWWVVNGNFHVYLLDSFAGVRNAGIARTLAYLDWCERLFARTGRIRAILIYGSFCRRKFHDRSDLDLRIVRRPGIGAAARVLPVAVLARLVSLLCGVPTDLQVVDSYEFLARQMRGDEKPIVVHGDPEGGPVGAGFSFAEVKANPAIASEMRESP
jgi:predicted nucleotidyltransferase